MKERRETTMKDSGTAASTKDTASRDALTIVVLLKLCLWASLLINLLLALAPAFLSLSNLQVCSDTECLDARKSGHFFRMVVFSGNLYFVVALSRWAATRYAVPSQFGRRVRFCFALGTVAITVTTIPFGTISYRVKRSPEIARTISGGEYDYFKGTAHVLDLFIERDQAEISPFKVIRVVSGKTHRRFDE